MSKQKLFDELIEKKLIPLDSEIKNFKVDQLKKILKDSEEPGDNFTTKKETLFEEAVRIKAVPVGAKESTYSKTILKSVVENHKKLLTQLEKDQKAKKRYKAENTKK